VNVHEPVRRHLEELERQDLAVRDHDRDVGGKLTDRLDELGRARAGGLQHLHTTGYGCFLHGRGLRGHPASRRTVGVSDTSRNLDVGIEQRLQAGHGPGRRAEENRSQN
jgi:hypothetical protein